MTHQNLSYIFLFQIKWTVYLFNEYIVQNINLKEGRYLFLGNPVELLQIQDVLMSVDTLYIFLFLHGFPFSEKYSFCRWFFCEIWIQRILEQRWWKPKYIISFTFLFFIPEWNICCFISVSYTHLTLPTIYSV